MKFMLLLYGDEAADAAMPVAEQRRVIEEHEVFTEQLHRDSAYLFGVAPDQSSTATTLRDEVVTDGPFLEGREQVGGIYVIQCADLDQALAYAKQVPKSPGLSVEVRPLLDI